MRSIMFLALALAACATHSFEATDAQPTTASLNARTNAARTLAERLRERPGAVPGLPGLQFVERADASFCTGVAVDVEGTPTASAAVGPAEQALAEFFAIRFPTNLDFSGDHDEVRKASLARFNRWLQDTEHRGRVAQEAYGSPAGTSRPDHIVAAARSAQVSRRLASLFVHAAIPLDVRTGEFAQDKVSAFCGKMAETAVPLLDRADAAAAECAKLAAGLARNWWSEVCAG